MKLSLIFVVLAISGWQAAFGTETNMEELEKLAEGGTLTEEYVKELIKEFANEDKESIKNLKAQIFRKTTEHSISSLTNPTNEEAVKLSRQYETKYSTQKRAYDHVKRKYGGYSYNDFYNYAKTADLPWEFCPTTPNDKCTDFDYRYRKLNGWCNNFKMPIGGAANTPYSRLLEHFYDNYCDAPTVRGKSGANLPNPRDVSLKLFRHIKTDSTISNLFLFFGQFLDHDIVLTPASTDYTSGKEPNCTCGTYNRLCANIDIPRYDPYFPYQRCLPFIRSSAASSISPKCKFTCREQMNSVTSALDLSSLYGNDDTTGKSVRQLEYGLLKYDTYNFNIYPAFKNPADASTGCCDKNPLDQCLVSGDSRAESNGYLFVIQTLFFYEHNRIAKELATRYPDCTDEVIFQEARRITIALFQKIVFNDWNPIALGSKVMKRYGIVPEPRGKFFNGYDDTNFPNVWNEFVLGMRFGHTLVKAQYYLADENCNPTRIQKTRDVLFVSSKLVCHNLFDSYVRAAVCDNTYYKFDQMTYDLSDHLFETYLGKGSSLSALNVQRGRDHGIPGYQAFRRFYKLKTSKTFQGLPNIRGETKKKLAELYASTEDIEWWVGAAVERSFRNYDPEGGVVGETLAHFLAHQFKLLKYHDRFFWESGDKLSNPFSIEQLDNIRSVNIGSLICQHVNIRQLQANPFRVPSNDNPIIPCSKFKNIDVSLFKVNAACHNPTVYNPFNPL